jgi:outer membrane protein assembly factor BamB
MTNFRCPLVSSTVLALPMLLAIGGTAEADGKRPADGAMWSQWRGAARDGHVTRGAWPDSFEGLTPQWRVALGKGYPGPVVSTETVFVVETVDPQTVAVRALDRESGGEVWKRTWPGSGSVPFFAAKNGDWVRSTPAFDGQTLFVGDMSEVLVALDGATGKVRWRVDFPARFGTSVPDFGFASSPLVDGDSLYVQAANSLVKLDKRSGETVWRALEGSGEIQASGAFSSPILASLSGVRQLVVLTRLTLFGVDPEEGRVLWSVDVPNFRGMNILTPVVHGDTVFTSPYKGQSYAYRVSSGDDGLVVEPGWTNKASGYMSSPVVVGDHVYLHLGNGRLDCLDLRTGESRWRSEPLGGYWSMAAHGDKILGLDEQGRLYLVRANPEAFELLDTRQVSEQPTWGHVAVEGDQVFVRELEGIRVFRWRGDEVGARAHNHGPDRAR